MTIYDIMMLLASPVSNMTLNDIITAVTTMGFPIVCCGALYYYILSTHNELIEAINTMNESIIKVLEHLKDDEEKE